MYEHVRCGIGRVKCGLSGVVSCEVVVLVKSVRKDFLRTSELPISRANIPARLGAYAYRKLHITHFDVNSNTTPNISLYTIALQIPANMARLSSLLFFLSAYVMSTSAQFGFFDQMFGNQGHQQHQEPQNVRSDSQWYQAQYEGGKFIQLEHSASV